MINLVTAHRMNNFKIVSAQQAKIAYSIKTSYTAQQHAIWGQDSLWIKIKIRSLYTLAKPTKQQAYKIVITFYKILHFLILLQKTLEYSMYYYCRVLCSGEF